MKIYDRRCFPDEGKQFVIAREILRDEHATLATYKVGEVIDFVLDDYISNGYVKEVNIPGFVFGLKGYKVGYYHKNGTFLHCGNPQVFPTKEIAKKYARNYSSYPWFDDEIVIEEAEYNGVPLNEPRIYNGKPVVDQEHYFGLDAHEVGEYFTSEMIDEFMNMLPPACMRRDCSQMGEPTTHRLDEVDNNIKATYATFKQIENGVWEYCGDCFRGENTMRGKEPIYV